MGFRGRPTDAPTLVSFAAVFRDVTQRSQGELRDIPKDGCEGDYTDPGLREGNLEIHIDTAGRKYMLRVTNKEMTQISEEKKVYIKLRNSGRHKKVKMASVTVT